MRIPLLRNSVTDAAAHARTLPLVGIFTPVLSYHLVSETGQGYKLLQRKAQQGVKVYVIVDKEVHPAHCTCGASI